MNDLDWIQPDELERMAEVGDVGAQDEIDRRRASALVLVRAS